MTASSPHFVTHLTIDEVDAVPSFCKDALIGMSARPQTVLRRVLAMFSMPGCPDPITNDVST